MTWGDIGAIFAVLVVGSLVAGIIDTWWKQRQREKNKRGVRSPLSPPFKGEGDNRGEVGVLNIQRG